MPDTFYTKAQIDQIAGIVGNRVTVETAPAKLKTEIGALPDTNFLTDAEKSKLTGLEGSKFLGVFADAPSIPTVSAGPGSYADVDSGAGGVDSQRYIWDVDDAKFVPAVGTVGGETAASVKTKYESNADTNAFTDAEKTKLGALAVATDTTDAVAALDGAIT